MWRRQRDQLRRRVGRSDERGSLIVELAVLMPAIAFFAVMAVAFGRVELARQEVIGAARAGAEAASVTPDPASARVAAKAMATPSVFGQAHTCTRLAVHTDTGAFEPGGFVGVTVSCRVALADVPVPGLPSSLEVAVVQRAPIDPYRVVR
jgi:Flp pilus assembly protein TadG